MRFHFKNPHLIRQTVPSFSSPQIANQNQGMQPTYQSEDSQSQPEQSSQESLDNSQISDPGLTNRKRKRPSIDQSDAGSVNNSQRNEEESNLKRLDFSQEIRNADLPDKRKEELLEFDDRTRMLRIVNAFTDEQVDRYELFRRSCFPRNQIKRLMQQVSGQAVNQQVCIAMSGVAKVFVGELVEEALKVAAQRGHEGALLPFHIREAVRRLSEVEGSNCFDFKRKRKRLF